LLSKIDRLRIPQTSPTPSPLAKDSNQSRIFGQTKKVKSLSGLVKNQLLFFSGSLREKRRKERQEKDNSAYGNAL